jgi:hypothetical protein
MVHQTSGRATGPLSGLVLVAIVSALAAGCGTKPANCQNAIDRLIQIEFYGQRRNPSLDEKKMIDQMLPGVRAKLVDWCERREFSTQDLQCVLDSRTHEAWMACGEFNSGYGPPLPEKLPKE